MGCVFGRYCDPGTPDPLVRHKWHVQGVIVEEQNVVERRRGGIVFVLNEAVCYKARRLDCRKTGSSLKLDIADISKTSRLKDYSCERDAVKGKDKVDVVLLEMHENKTVGMISKESEKMHAELTDIIDKHRQRPKIIQFNSIDIDGVEIDLP